LLAGLNAGLVAAATVVGQSPGQATVSGATAAPAIVASAQATVIAGLAAVPEANGSATLEAPAPIQTESPSAQVASSVPESMPFAAKLESSVLPSSTPEAIQLEAAGPIKSPRPGLSAPTPGTLAISSPPEVKQEPATSPAALRAVSPQSELPLEAVESLEVRQRDFLVQAEPAKELGRAISTATSNRTLPTQTQAPLADQIKEAVVSRLETLHEHGRAEVHVRLNPPELGPVRIHLVGERQVEGRLVVHEEATRQLLEAQLPVLRHRLEEVGVTLGRLDVTRDGAGSSDQSQRRPALPWWEGEPWRPATPITPKTATVIPELIRAEGINVLA